MKKTREQYIESLKSNLDVLNADLARWELEAKDARDEARERGAKALELVQARREDLRYQLTLLQSAAGEAWADLAQGADIAIAKMRETIAHARTHFTR